jgi:hypothetical protein
MASMLAIFMAARFKKNAPRIVSYGFDLVRALLISSGSKLSNTLCEQQNDRSKVKSTTEI